MTEAGSSTKDPVEVHVAGQQQPEAARLLLAAARELDLEADVVQTIAGGFLVPHEVAVQAGALNDDEPQAATETQIAAHPEVTETEDDSASQLEQQQEIQGEAGPEIPLEQQGAVETSDGVVHEGVVPASSEQPALKGEALEAALKQRNLSTAGSADEKRARVAEFDAQQGSVQQ